MCLQLIHDHRAEHQFSAVSSLIRFLRQSVAQKKSVLSGRTSYNLSKEHFKVNGNINMDQLGSGYTRDNRLPGSHWIKRSSVPICRYCGISTLDPLDPPPSPSRDARRPLWLWLRYSFDSKTLKMKPFGAKGCILWGLCCLLTECHVAVAGILEISI